MKRINLTITTSCKGPGKQKAVGTYLIELVSEDKVTTHEGYLERDSISAAELTLQLLVNAMFIINKMHLELYSIEAYIDQPIILSAFRNRWIDKWQQAKWKNAQGKDIANAATWQKLIDQIGSNAERFIAVDEVSSYTNWCRTECIKRLKGE